MPEATMPDANMQLQNMPVAAATAPEHGRYLLLMKVPSRLSDQEIDGYFSAIHNAYMGQYRAFGAWTWWFLKLGSVVERGTNVAARTAWTHAIQYVGPVASVAQLEEQIANAFRSVGTVETQTMSVLQDVTGRY